MANSSSIEKIKNKVIREMISDLEIVKAINADEIPEEKAEDLIGTHIFDYNQNPNTINTVGTFITIQLHIPYIRNNIYVNPTLEIWIISHEKHMPVNNIPKIKSNRNDYISNLLDIKFNGKFNYGIGSLKLVSNVESSYQQNYLVRKMIFQCMDLNNSLCKEEESV